jgi:hypothetical protein
LCGWRTFFYTEVAASQDYGPINFVSDNDLQMKEWGGGIIEDQRKDKVFKLFYDLNECFDWVLGGGGAGCVCLLIKFPVNKMGDRNRRSKLFLFRRSKVKTKFFRRNNNIKANK